MSTDHCCSHIILYNKQATVLIKCLVIAITLPRHCLEQNVTQPPPYLVRFNCMQISHPQKLTAAVTLVEIISQVYSVGLVGIVCSCSSTFMFIISPCFSEYYDKFVGDGEICAAFVERGRLHFFTAVVL